jgi:putative hydrolase of the HAD superfamily
VGTLIEPVPSVSAAYTEAAARQGVELERSIVRERFLRHFGADELDEAKGTLATDEDVERRRWTRIVANVLPELPDRERGFLELWDHFGEPHAWRVFDDVAESLRQLEAAGVVFRIASNFDGRLRRIVTGLDALAEYADRLLISSEMGWRKPHPAFYRAACESLGALPQDVLCVGDDLENDWLGPRRAGLHACLVDRDRRAPADVTVYGDLRQLVADLLS